MDQNLDTSLFRVLWPPHYRGPQPHMVMQLTAELYKRDQREAELNESAIDRGERTWDQRN